MKSYSITKPFFFSLLIALLSMGMVSSCSKDEELINNETAYPDEIKEEIKENEEERKDDDEDYKIWDMAPVEAYIFIEDAEGNNLLSPNTPNNIYGKRIIAEYEGMEYELEWSNRLQTRAYLPSFTGLTLKMGYTLTDQDLKPDPDKSYLTFGEFEGMENQDISLTLKIQDCPENWNIRVTHSIKWEGGDPKVNNAAFLNGEEVSYYHIPIIL